MRESNQNNINLDSRKYKWKSFMRINSSQVSMFFAVAICFIIVSFASPYFLTPSNLSNVGVSMATYGVLSAGLTVCMLLGGLDLSQMAVMAVTSMVIGLLLRNGLPVGLALISALAIGMLAGAINGFIVTQMKITGGDYKKSD
jgi:ribose transport system permease protein